MKAQRAFLCLTILYLDMCYGQRDCTGMECPVLHNCIETVLESGACCPTCTQRGCTCEGYQYYDCIQAGFRRGKVPEGESYFVDFGSTECSCPRGGGKISCHFIPCPEISPNCIDVLQPEDGCPQCRRIGCVHGNKKYEAGHSFQIERCQVCHCPNEGGSLMCSPVPGCGQNMANRPSVSENKYRLKDISGRHDSRQTNHAEPLSNLALGNTLPLYKPDPPSSGTEDSDYTRAQPTSSTFHNLEQPLESTTVPPAHPESSSTSDDGRRHELKQTQSSPNPEESGHADVSHNTDPTVSEAHRESLLTAKTSQGATTANHRPQHGTGERTIRHNSERSRAAQDGVQSATNATRTNKSGRNSSKHHRHSQSEPQSVSNKRQEHEEKPYPTIQFSPTSRPPVRVRDYGEQPRRQAQTLFNYQPQYAERNAEVSSKELLKGCCETGEKWASANGHCNSMEPPTQDWHSICWTAQQQCCLGSLREQQCLSGIKAATGGDTCEKDTGDKCGINSFKECCGCCSLGLHFRSEGHRCEAHPSLGFHCRHIFLTCCEGEEQEEEGPGGHNGWHTVKERPALDPTTAPKKVSDSPFPKEAFLLGQEREGENTVESPVELKDMDECLIHQGNICHHICVNTPGSFRCECFQGYVLQDDAVTCATETVEDQNRLKEDNRVEPRLPPSPPTEASVPHDPCEGNNRCEQQCTPVGGWPQCSCFPGFVLRTNGYSCEDINECLSLHACQLNERCLNTAGSYICQRLITCPTGYHISNDMCEDINECLQENHNCGSDYDCVNTMGSFRCNPKPRCSVGFSKDLQGNCADIDECSLSQPCGPGFNCINTAGSYMCHRKIICSRGYHSSPDGSRCIDVDECQSGLHRCGEGQLCHNMPGSYRCECQTGYQYDSFRRICVDVNECWRYPGRLCAQTCENTPGSYHCSCTTGFRLSGDGKNCEDVNECLSNPCGQECTNIYGSYQCYCTQGYYLREDGHTCDDIDECSQSIGHLCTYKCVNVAGSYQCACPEYGYTMSPNGRSCRDIDECTTGTHNCSLSETCYNIQGGYRCLSFSCPPNYRSVSDTRCERISCPNYLDCQNSPLRITYYYLSFQSNIVIPAQIFRIGPSPAYSGDNVIVSITQGNDENYFSTRKLNAYTGAVYLHRQVEGPRDFLITVEMKLWRQGTFTTFHARIYVFITGTSL